MASSKTPPLSKSKQSKADLDRTPKVAVALSGGLDSTALLHSAIAAHGADNVIAFHINHGLQKQADRWLIHCARITTEMGVDFDFRLLELGANEKSNSNLEAKAREARYEALREMCHAHGVTNLLLGHHQDDQAETVILQLIRGSGIAGLAAMPIVRDDISSPIRLWRPFLELTRSEIESYANEHQLEWIEDPSNADERFTRNAVRKRVIPLLEKIQPQVVKNLSRTAAHLAQAKELLDDLADIDLNGMVIDGGIKISQLMTLRQENSARASNVLRRWLQLNQLIMPSEERLGSWWKDLDESGAKLQIKLEWLHDGFKLRLWRGILTVTEEQGQKGSWIFRELDPKSDEPGLPLRLFEEAKLEQSISERERQGGEKMRIHAKRPRRILKNLFQEFDIPPWQRDALLLFIGDELLAVAGIGMNADFTTTSGERVVAEWVVEP